MKEVKDVKGKIRPHYSVAKKQKGRGRMAMLDAAIRCCENGSSSTALGCLLMLKGKLKRENQERASGS